MMRKMFFCIDGHTGGNPVRMVVGGAPFLTGDTMSSRRHDFVERFDWIRKGLMFEPRGHDLMSGGFVLPPLSTENDASLLFMETSGSLPLCGHGTIGMVTFALEHGVILPQKEGRLRLETPAGLIEVRFTRQGDKVTTVCVEAVPSFVHTRDVIFVDPEFGSLSVDIVYGGNFYAILEPQAGYDGIDAVGRERIVGASVRMIRAIEEVVKPIHPLDPTIRGIQHLMWTDDNSEDGTRGRAAVYFGEMGIDHGPCGTGTAARVAQLFARGALSIGDGFDQLSHVGTGFLGTAVRETHVDHLPAVITSFEGVAHVTAYNQIWIDSREPFPEGFVVR